MDAKNLSIVIPIGPKETESGLLALAEYLEGFVGAEVIYEREGPLWDARRRGVSKITQPYTLCLDVDTRLPEGYVEDAIKKVDEGYFAVSIDYAPPHVQGHASFGASVWSTKELKRLYDWKLRKDRLFVKVGEREFANISSLFCECRYMWLRIREEGGNSAS